MNDPPTEVEAKLVASAPNAVLVIKALSSAPVIGGLDAGPPTALDLRDVYIDTPARALTQWRGAMRIRTKNGQALLTIKGPAADRTGPAISRPELELPFTTGNVHRALAWLAAQMDDARDVPDQPDVGVDPPAIDGFGPFHDRTTARIKRELTTPHGPVEVAIDQARYAVGDTKITLVEIEVEALGDTPIQGVIDGAAAIQAHCQPIGPLRPWQHSKLSVGLALERLGDASDLTDEGVLTHAGLDRVHAELS